MSSRNALNPIWEETFELDIHLPDLAFLRFTVVDVISNMTMAQRVVPLNRLRPGYRHLRLHNEMDQPLPLSQLFLFSHFSEESEQLSSEEPMEKLGRKRMSFLVVHDISDSSPYAILKVPENATAKDVIKQAVIKGGNKVLILHQRTGSKTLIPLGLDTSKEHEYVLLEEVVNASTSSQSSNFLHNNNTLLPTPNQRMVGMQEMPLQVRNKWRHETKFVLKRVGQDPSWRARLGNLMSFNEDQEEETSASGATRQPSEDQDDEDEGKEFPASGGSGNNAADHFLVCVFNVSSKVSYSILQVAKTSTVKDVIVQALAKNRKDSENDGRKSADDYVLVEEIDVLDASRKANKSNKVKRIIDPSENVYLIQLSWKGAGRFILEDKDKLANEHGPLTESYSDPLGSSGAAGGLSPSLRRHSR